jgi:signal transduction histidine kinase
VASTTIRSTAVARSQPLPDAMTSSDKVPLDPGVATAPPSTEKLRPQMIWLGAAILIATVWSGIAVYLNFEKKDSLDSAAKQAEIHAKLLEEHTTRTVRVLDQTTVFVKGEAERDPRNFDLSRYARDGVFLDNFFNLIATADETGQTQQIIPKRPASYIKDREHFSVHVAEDTANLFISKPVLGRSSGKWSLQFTRRINKPDGSFGGIVVTSLDPGYFTEFYKSVNLGTGSVTALVGSDGIIRARRTDNSSEIGQDIRQSTLFEKIAVSSAGTYEGTSSVDSVSRIYAYRRLKDYPLIVVVGISEESVLTEFKQHSTLMTGLGIAMTVLLLLATAALQRTLKAQERVNVAMENSAREAREATRIKSEFISRISHELRTPLTGILGYSEYLKDHAKDPEDRETAKTIHESGEHLLALVNTTLDLAKIEAGRMTLNASSANLGEVLEKVFVLHSGNAKKKGIEIHLKVDESLPKVFVMDVTKVSQVLNNLVQNAIKFTDYGFVHLLVGKSVAGNQIQFSIIDSGIGIPLEKQNQIFDRFRQLDNFITRQQEGSGLGLALSKDLVEFMGGEIWFESKPGLGSTFHFTLPLKYE